ncbi:stalk domain-containing protein (plasmid) [Aneurinibacillus sp. Ricciae_BoGa-3]|uniref:stalk domain-containing protein n=1 Tax=Aneurinibacillus sp. Ricciae_BoGa-3 TaxID=3022697 RepID=UPI0023406A40|nr:stalk domain-containing protein [Aneurinibacillus sp. Ricciae_BoGa-3]WCK57154.1 stalk domain-containing protein [Aneurinibacillus sp. Ricciae_BoGa-3]
MNKTLYCAITSVALLSTTAKVFATPIVIDGKTVSNEAIQKDNRTLVPLRGVVDKLGAKIFWESSTQTVTAINYSEGKSLQLVIGNVQAKINGKPFLLDVPAQIIKGKTYVPIRFISEQYNAQVNYDNANRTVTITTVKNNNGMPDNTFTRPANSSTNNVITSTNTGNGTVINFNPPKEIITINFHNGKYVGESLNYLPDGQGKVYDNQGRLMFEGTFNAGTFTYGKLYNEQTGDLFYEGQFANWLPNGTGKIYLGGKLFYEGGMKDGKRSGYGVQYITSTGQIGFSGQYINDVPQSSH